MPDRIFSSCLTYRKSIFVQDLQLEPGCQVTDVRRHKLSHITIDVKRNGLDAVPWNLQQLGYSQAQHKLDSFPTPSLHHLGTGTLGCTRHLILCDNRREAADLRPLRPSVFPLLEQPSTRKVPDRFPPLPRRDGLCRRCRPASWQPFGQTLIAIRGMDPQSTNEQHLLSGASLQYKHNERHLSLQCDISR